MLLIQIPKDIREFEPKFIGPFSARQCICLLSAAVIEFAGATLLKHLFVQPLSTYMPPLILAAIPIILGWGEDVLHMKPEVYFREVFLRSLKYPKVRPYKTHNVISRSAMEIEEQKKQNTTQKTKQKKSPSKDLPEELRAYK